MALCPARQPTTRCSKLFIFLNSFDIPKGVVRESENPDLTDDTIWTSASDTRNAVYYYKTYLGQAVECVRVRAAVKGLKAPFTLSMDNSFLVRDRTSEVRK